MKHITLFLISVCTFIHIHAQVKTITADTDWKAQQSIIKNSAEADCIIRLGDIDNLGFGWPEGFDPFCGRMSDSHGFPWEANPADLPGFDRILLSSKFKPSAEHSCGADGYSGSFDATLCKPVTWSLSTGILKDMVIKNAYLQLFIDDFQANQLCSKFQLLVNGKRFVEGEKILNAIDQTGPVGKLISIPLTEDYFPQLTSMGTLKIYIDEMNGSADGFALDFIRLLVNRKRENTCKGVVRGKVLEKDTDKPIAAAKIFTADHETVLSNAQGEFEMKDIPAGFEVLGATAAGYIDGTATADIGEGDQNPEVIIYLAKGKSARFDKQQLQVGESIVLNNILFDQGKSEIKPQSIPDLEKLVSFMQANPGAEIELSGHTSSEGDRAYNRSLSYKRVKACKDFLVSKNISEDRVIAVGYGPDRPAVANDTEANRAKNRRVEMRLKKL
jgi:outer membrane protein OmpA-like peptidoglycan-associated protein